MLGAALIAVGAGLALIGRSMPPGGAEAIVRGMPVNPGATDPKDFSSHNSPVIARSPTRPSHLVVANRIDAPIFSCALHRSSDGGETWKAERLPFPPGQELPERCYAPDVAFGPDGTLYVSFVTLKGIGNTPDAGWLVSAKDGESALGEPVPLLGALAFQVQLAADPETAGRLYLTWVQAQGTGTLGFAESGNPILFARSDDGGKTWSEPAQVNSPARSRSLAPSIVAASGVLHVLYLDVGDDALDYHAGHEGRGGPPFPGRWSLVLARSDDDGGTWKETVVDDDVVATQRFIPFIPPAPSLAVDAERDRVYAGFHDGRLGDADVRVWTSPDGGDTFSAAVRVNDTKVQDGTDQYLPALAVSPTGRLDVAYYDRREDADNRMNEVSLQSSDDGAATFGPRVELSDRAFDAGIGPGAERDLPDLGNRLGLASSDDRAVAIWSDTRAGTVASAKQDLASGVVAFQSASPLRGALPPIGVAVALVGLAVAIIGPRKRPVPSSLNPNAEPAFAGAAGDSSQRESHGR